MGLMMGYGWYFCLNSRGLWVMINGRMFSIFRGCNTNRWQLSVWNNGRRKQGKITINTGDRKNAKVEFND
jgi:hypothetical protein